MQSKNVIVHGQSWELADFGDNEPRVRDLDLARQLGFAQPRMIRKLIKRHSEKLAELGTCSTVSHVVRGNPVKESWLNQRQAYYLVTKSETPRADEIVIRMIDVYLAWADGASPQQIDPQLVQRIAALEAKVDKLAQGVVTVWQRLEQLHQQLPVGGCISPSRHDALRVSWNQLTDVEVLVGKWPSARAARADILREMGEMTQWGGSGKPWRALPQHLEPVARVVIERRMRAATKHKSPTAGQLLMFRPKKSG